MTERPDAQPGLRRRYVRVVFAAAVVALLVWSSVWTVSRDEQGVVTRFGRVARVVTSGIQFTLPWPIEWLERVSTSEVRVATIGVPAGRSFIKDPAQWLTGDTNIVELRVAIQYVVDDPEAYLYSIAPLADERPIDEMIHIVTHAELTELIARMPIDDVLSVGKARLQQEARVKLQELLGELGTGMRVLAVSIAEARPPSEVIASFNDVASAESDRERLLSEADGYRRDLMPKYRSKANATLQEALIYKDKVVSVARGASARFSALAEQVRAQPEISRYRLWLDAVAGVFAKVKAIVYEPREGGDFVLRVVE